MNKKVAALILAASTSVAITGLKSEKVLATELDNANNTNAHNETSSQNENVREVKKAKVVNVSTNLRIRSSASTNSSIVGTLSPGAVVNVEGTSGEFYKIEFNGVRGYSHKDYLQLTTSGNSGSGNSGGTESTVNKTGQVINVTTSLRVRASASTSASIIGSLAPNEKFNIIGETSSWYKINHKGKVGYIHKDYAKVVTSETVPETPSTPNVPNPPSVSEDSGRGKVVNVTTNLRMRSNPSTSASIVGYLVAGDTFDITGTSGSWYKIKHNGKSGYVHSDYVQKINSNDSSNNNDSSQTTNSYEKVLSIMKSHVGTPYVFGGSGEEITTASLNALKNRFPGQQYIVPSKYMNSGYRAFDCSGFTQWAFRQVGISLGRTTYDQIKNGKEVSVNSVKPGDLLFFSNLGHVGMYIGDGKWIESPKTGEYVRITTVPWSLIGRARRVL